jgi:general secretion pathway protein D
MRCIKLFLLGLFFASFLYAQEEQITLNFNETPIEDVVKFVSKAIDSNILITERISGNVNFLSHKPIDKEELLPFLRRILNAKGFTVVENSGGYLEVVKSNQALAEASLKSSDAGMVTAIVDVLRTKPSKLLGQVKHLGDVNGVISADDEKSQFLIVDYADNIRKLRGLIAKLDDNVEKTTVFVTLENHFAADVSKHIEMIFSAMKDEFKGEVKILLIAHSNSIAVICDARDEAKAIETIKSFDVKNPKMSIYTDVIPLNNAKASELFTILDIMIKSLKSEAPIAIAAKEDINAIAVSGNKEQIEMVREITRKLDVQKKQIFLATQIFEISENNLEKLGIKWGISGGAADTTSVYTGTVNMGGTPLALFDGLTEFVDPDTINKGLAIGAMIDLLKVNGVVNTLSEPTLLAVNNVKSSIYVGKTKSIMTSTATGDNANDVTRNNFTREDIGLTLEVTPQIAQDDKVVLELLVEAEDIDGSDSANADRPTTTKREIKTTSVVMNEESVIVGGLMKDYYSKTDSKVPFLGDIPFLGGLFRSTNETFDKLNLVVIVTPYIINGANDVQDVQNKISKIGAMKKELGKKFEAKIIENAKKQESDNAKE